MPKLSRETLVNALKQSLEQLSFLDAAWLAGSESFGRQDKYSDIDLNVLGEDEHAPATFAAAEKALAALSPIVLRHPMPSPTFWGGHQRFYRLRDTSEFLMIDLCYLLPGRYEEFLEPKRHGRAIVLFDRKGALSPTALDEGALLARLRARLEQLRTSFPMFQNLVRKAVLRGDLAEASAFYQGQTFRPLIEILRMRHCPERFDYGARYTRVDLPKAVAKTVAELALPSSGPDMLKKQKRAEKLFARTLAALNARKS